MLAISAQSQPAANGLSARPVMGSVRVGAFASAKFAVTQTRPETKSKMTEQIVSRLKLARSLLLTRFPPQRQRAKQRQLLPDIRHLR